MVYWVTDSPRNRIQDILVSPSSTVEPVALPEMDIVSEASGAEVEITKPTVAVVAVVVIPEARVDSLKGGILVVAVVVPTIREPIKATPPERTKAMERSSSLCTLPQATRVSLQ